MKKLLSVVMVLALVAFVAQAQDVTSVNVAGVINVQIPANGLAIVGVNLDAFDPADQNLLGILGGQLAQGTQFDDSTADKVVMWDTAASAYKTYGMRDGAFYDLDDWAFGSPTNPPVQPGQGFWLKSAGTQIDLSLTGEAIADSQSQVPIYPGLQFLAFPFSCVMDIQDSALEVSGASKGEQFDDSNADKIVFWNGTQYKTYGLREDGQWYDLDNWAFGSPVTGVVMDLGEGFWYNRVVSSNMVWTQDNPYEGNL